VPIVGFLDRDEHPRPNTTREALAALKPAFRKDGMSPRGMPAEFRMERRQWFSLRQTKPTTRNPTVWPESSPGASRVRTRGDGIGPVPAMKMALDRAGLALKKSISSRSMKLSPVSILPWKRNLNLIGQK